jgi:predicted Zn-dependent protease
LAVGALVGLLYVTSLSAQRPVNAGPPQPPVATPDSFPETSPIHFDSPMLPPLAGAAEISGEVGHLVDSESCNSWTESGVTSPTVSAKRLEIPGRAQGEFQKGCGAFKGKRIAEAEDHLRHAIDFYPDYAAAWVVLGQVLSTENKSDEGRTACSKAAEIDPQYVASYLCLAEFAATSTDWRAVTKFSEQALAIDPIGNPYSLYYAADAGLHQNQLSQAEMHAQAAVKLDEWHHLPELHLLLAQIYEAAGNVVGETTQLKEFLKTGANSKDAARAKSMLAILLATPPPAAPAASKDNPTRSGAPAK